MYSYCTGSVTGRVTVDLRGDTVLFFFFLLINPSWFLFHSVLKILPDLFL